MFNVIHGNPTDMNCKLTLDTREYKLYGGEFAAEFGVQTHQQSHHCKEMKGDQLNICLFDGTYYCWDT